MYPDSKHAGERAALEAAERHGVELVVVNPGYVLGVPVDRSQPGETSTRTIGNYLRGRLPGVLDAPMNFVDVADVATGELLAAEHGKPGERYILGGVNLGWAELIDRVAELSAVHYPIMVLPMSIRRLMRIREALGLPGALSAEASKLMGQDWRFTSRKAHEELGYATRPLDETLAATIEWYVELIEAGAFEDSRVSGLSRWADSMRIASRLGLLTPLRVGQRVTGRRIVAGGKRALRLPGNVHNPADATAQRRLTRTGISSCAGASARRTGGRPARRSPRDRRAARAVR